MSELNQLLEIAKEKGISAYKLNKLTGLNTGAIQSILDGKTKSPRPYTVMQLLNAINDNYAENNTPTLTQPSDDIAELKQKNKELIETNARLSRAIENLSKKV